MKNHFTIAALFIFAINSQAWAQKIIFNPDAPLYIEYKTSEKTTATDISVQIDDATSPSKIRLSLQSKPDAAATYYGYIWLQLGKKITKEVIFKRGHALSGWLTDQDDIQALFLFDNEKDMADFKTKALQSKKPLTDKNALPQLTSAAPTPAPTVSKSIEVGAEMTEVAKYAKLMEAYNAFTPEQKKVNDAKAEQLAQSALKLYQAKNYSAAEAQFEESLRLNPTLAINRYYLGICYYQTKKYDRSLALLSLAEGAEYNYAEYKYYNGLDNMKLKNYTKASESFDSAKDENDAEYSGSAAFYNGHILFQKEDYVQSRQNFEYTVDYSKNPKMDSEAEAMLEKIDAIEGVNRQSKEKFSYLLYIGFGYDSNVLNVSTENRATDLAGYRLMYGGEFNYRIFRTISQDMSVGVNATDFYSLNNKFKSDATIQSVDPLTYGVNLPYHYHFQIGSRQFNWGLLPSYQILNMSYETTERKKLLDTITIGTDLTFAFTPKHFSRFYLEYAMEKMDPPPALAEDNLTGNRITFATTQTFVTSEKVKESWDADLSYALNSSDGDNNDYNKMALGITYSRMGIWNALNTARLDYAMTKYDHALIERDDKVATASLGIIKELSKQLSLNLSGLYTLSQSTNESYKYNKFALQSMLAYSGAF